MKRTYRSFLDSLDMYAVGATVELSFYEWSENEVLYRQAVQDGYIMLVTCYSSGNPYMKVIEKPVNPYKLAETYFG